MKSEISTLNTIRQKFNSTQILKPFKEDDLINSNKKKTDKLNQNSIKNFVPVIKPKKALIKPTPLQLNPEPFHKKTKLQIILCNKKYKESQNISFDSYDYDEISSSYDSDYSSSEEINEKEIEKLNKDYSTSDKSPKIKYKGENENENERIIL